MQTSVSDLLDRARAEQLTRTGEVFNAPERVQRLADTIAVLANRLEQEHNLRIGLQVARLLPTVGMVRGTKPRARRRTKAEMAAAREQGRA
jgi:hypothetical protein